MADYNDYIDRKAAIDALGERPLVWTEDDYYSIGARNQYDGDRLAIETIPSADVEPVVRCKDCANWNRETHGCLRNPSVSPWWEDDFCNYGARRDPEADYEWSEEEQAYIEQGYMDTQVGLPDLYMN